MWRYGLSLDMHSAIGNKIEMKVVMQMIVH